MKTNTKPIQLFLLTAFFLAAIAIPQAEAGRPLNTDDAGVVSVKTLEVETAYEYAHSSNKENNFSVVLTTGLLDSLDLGVEVPYQFIDLEDATNQNGFSDIGLTSKWNFLSREDLFDATLSFSYKSDNGNDNKSLGTGKPEFTVLAIFSREFERFSAHLNMGPTIVKDDNDLFNYNLAFEWPLGNPLTLVAELFGSYNSQDSFHTNALSTQMGVTYELSENAVYDLGFTLGLSEADPDFKITTGLTLAFGPGS